MRKRKIWCVVLVLVFIVPAISAEVTSPERFLGFQVGTAKKLADMNQIVAYFRMLDEQSEKITVREVGKTTEGNPFIVAVITSKKNQKNSKAPQPHSESIFSVASLTILYFYEYLAGFSMNLTTFRNFSSFVCV